MCKTSDRKLGRAVCSSSWETCEHISTRIMTIKLRTLPCLPATEHAPGDTLCSAMDGKIYARVLTDNTSATTLLDHLDSSIFVRKHDTSRVHSKDFVPFFWCHCAFMTVQVGISRVRRSVDLHSITGLECMIPALATIYPRELSYLHEVKSCTWVMDLLHQDYPTLQQSSL